MNSNYSPILAVAALLLTALPAGAQSLVDGDAERGKAKAITCTACHGAAGNSMNPLWPNIAGQNAKYLEAQLQAFKGDPENQIPGTRMDPLMTSQAIMLSAQDMKDLAVYFEGLPAAAQAVANPDPKSIARAEALYRGGNAEEGAPACIACHGPTGRGNPAAAYPALNGQHAAYTAKQLRDYAAGTRQSDEPTHQMRNIAERLSKEDIQAIASYVQGLK